MEPFTGVVHIFTVLTVVETVKVGGKTINKVKLSVRPLYKAHKVDLGSCVRQNTERIT